MFYLKVGKSNKNSPPPQHHHPHYFNVRYSHRIHSVVCIVTFLISF